MSTSFRRLLLVPTLFAALLLLAACEESVDPILHTNRHYSLYGFLNMNRDTQYVRVDEIRASLQVTGREPLPGTVTSRDLVTGETVTWRDSVFTYEDGTIAHVFWAPLRVIPAHRYRLEATRAADGAVTWVETTIPPLPVAVVRPAETRVIGQDIIVTQTVLWQNVDMAPDSTATWYRMFAGAGRPFNDISLPPSRAEMTEDGWEARINITTDRDSLLARGGLGILLGMGMNIIVRDTAWDPPGGRFDPRVLSQPGVFSNVENGFGFVGAAGTFGVEWVIDPVVAGQLGFPLPGKR